MKINKKFKDYFSFSRIERRGINILIILIIISLILRIASDSFHKRSVSDSVAFLDEIKEWENSLRADDKLSANFISKKEPVKEVLLLKQFDPNKITELELKEMGINPYAINSWIKYLKGGGKFYKSDDIYKIYALDSSVCKKLESFIVIPASAEKNINESPIKTKKLINLNKASKEEIEELKGIGPVLSERIISYRTLLGGYSDLTQIKEVFGLTDSTFRNIKGQLLIDTSLIVKMDLNKSDEYTLSKHPYIKKYYAKSIISYRKTMGPIKNIYELSVNKVVPDSVYKKIKPYFSY